MLEREVSRLCSSESPSLEKQEKQETRAFQSKKLIKKREKGGWR